MFGQLLKLQFLSFKQAFLNKEKQFSKGRAALMIILYGYLFIVFLFLFATAFFALCKPYHEAGVDWLYFAFCALTSVMLCVIGSSFMTMNQLFRAKDNELLLSMPIPPKYIMLARMTAVIILNAAFCAVIFLPAGVIRLIMLPVNAGETILFILGYFLTLMFATALCCLFGYLLALITAKAKNKNIVSIIFTVVFLAAYFYLYNKMDEIIALLSENGATVAMKMKAWILPFYCFGNGMENIWLYLIYAALCIGVFALCCYLIAKSFIKIATTKDTQTDMEYKGGEMKAASPFMAMLKKELLKLKSSAVYMMNSCISVILLPLALFFLIYKGAALTEVLSQNLPWEINLYAAVIGFICTINGMNTISASALSLEGKSLWILKSVPVKPAVMLLAKAGAHFTVGTPVAVLCAVVAAPFLKTDVLSVITGILLILACNAFTALFGTLINFLMPRFDWNNEVEPIKQSTCVLICIMTGMLGGIMMTAAIFFGSIFIKAYIIFIAITVIISIIDLILFLCLKNKSDGRFARL